MQQEILDIDLSDPGGLPDKAIAEAVAVLQTGRLHRYGEYGGDAPQAALFEREYADYMGCRYAIAVNSGGCALFLALKIAGVRAGDPVLVNGFNLAPVPGAIEHAGAAAVLVETNPDFRIDSTDLQHKAATSAAKVLLLTHMRGHIADMDAIVRICEDRGLLLIEDCAHTMGARWNGQLTGTFGSIGCFSTQTFKHINAGEGGIIVTDDDDMAAQAILYSGSYMLYGQHQSAPPPAVFARWQPRIPNYSMRMSNLAAAILRPQLRELARYGEQWNERYHWLATRLNAVAGIRVPERDPKEQFIASSIQFHFTDLDREQIRALVTRCVARGVAIKWFGREQPLGYTSQYDHWQYLENQSLPTTTTVLATTCDLRIPRTLTPKHCDLIAAIIQQEMEGLRAED